jgi:hypothetical protein
VPEGRYRLVHRVEAELLESDYENNAASMLLELRWPGSPEEPLTVEVPESCPDAARCLCGQWASVIKFLPNADSQSLYRGRATSSPGDPSPLTPMLVLGALGVREVLETSSTRHTNFVVRCRCEWVLHASTFLAYPSAESATEVQETRIRAWL